MATETQFFLDLERPVVELETKIDELRRLADDEGHELTAEVARLEAKAERLRTEIFSNLSRWQRVQLARHRDRPYSLDYISMTMEDFSELHGDRNYGDDPALVGGPARFDGRRVIVIGQQKGRKTPEKIRRHFGMPHPEGYRKALRLMEMAERFSMPVICLIDTPGAHPGVGAEERGQAEAIARNLFEMARLNTPIVVAVIGEGASGGALGIGVGDRVLMQENAWYSVISPEGCAAILWRTKDHAEQAADAMKVTASDLLELGVIDEVISEPLGGAQRDPEQAAAALSDRLASHLDEVCAIPLDELRQQRIARYEALGRWDDIAANGTG